MTYTIRLGTDVILKYPSGKYHHTTIHAIDGDNIQLDYPRRWFKGKVSYGTVIMIPKDKEELDQYLEFIRQQSYTFNMRRKLDNLTDLTYDQAVEIGKILDKRRVK